MSPRGTECALEETRAACKPMARKPDNNVMHAKPDLRVFLKWTIAHSGSVITDVIPLKTPLPLKRIDSSKQLPMNNKHATNEKPLGPQFTTRLLFAITAAIAVGFVSPLGPMVYLVNVVFFTSIIAVPIIIFWLVVTPVSRWRESMGATTRFFGLAVAVFTAIFVIILIRMEVMGQDF